MSEELIIEHCSPTLAGIKAGSMFSVRVTEDTDINKEVRELNKVLREKGLRVIPLKITSKYALIYIYRPDHLKKDLNDPQALSILKKMGYEPRNLSHLRSSMIVSVTLPFVFESIISVNLSFTM